MGAQYVRMSSSQSDENTTNGTKSLSRSHNMEFIIVARPLGMKLYPSELGHLQVVSVHPEGVGNVVGFEFGDRILAVNDEDYGAPKKMLHRLQTCKLPMTLQVFRPDELPLDVVEDSEAFSHSRSISVDSTTSGCNLCAVCNLEDTVLYMNPCYHDVCHACWENLRKRGEPQKCPLCQFPVKSAHPISHYHVPSRTVLTKIRPFLEVNLRFPPAVLELVFDFLTFDFLVGDQVVVRDPEKTGSCAWIEGTVSCAKPLTISIHGENTKEWPEVLPFDEPRPELFQLTRSTSTDWPWPRPLNSPLLAEEEQVQKYSRDLAPKWFRGRRYYRKLRRLESELVAGLPCRPSQTWSQSARPSLLFAPSCSSSKSRNSLTITASENTNGLTLSSFSAESFGDENEDEAERMKQIVDFIHRLKARKS